MKILITGANGFIGSALVEVLLAEGHYLVACGRHRDNLPLSSRVEFVKVDLSGMLNPDQWLSLTQGVDAVINCAGILKASTAQFDKVHHAAPLALARACATSGVKRFIQLSALGHPDDGEFIASKHRLDQALGHLELDAWIIRPSVVVSLRGSYGGTSAMRALASLPGLLVVPGDGTQKIQPILLEDLARILVAAATADITPHCEHRAVIVEAVGPDILPLEELLRLTRSWLKFPAAILTLHLPSSLSLCSAWIADKATSGPLGLTLWRMLCRGNVGQIDADKLTAQQTGVAACSVRQALTVNASFVQDRWHARLWLLSPMVWLSLVSIWILSGISGILASPGDYTPILSAMGITTSVHTTLVAAASLWNLLLGICLLFGLLTQWVLRLMLISVIGYTLAFSLFVPLFWLDLTGGLLKNLAVMALLLVYSILRENR